jgi:tRNA-splicing ligase RtcB
MKVFGEHDQKTIDQLARCVEAEEGALGVLCADGHLGYSQPIGGAVAYEDHISPSGVGYDIACGNKAVCTNLMAEDVVGTETWRLLQGAAGETPPEMATDISQGREVTLEGELKNEASVHAYSNLRPENALDRIMDEIVDRISFGMGRSNKEPDADAPVLDAIRQAQFEPQRKLYDLAAKQLGTVGAGNHYVDLFADEGGKLWVGCHFGSRGFGHKTASGFLALAQGKQFTERAHEGEMESPPVLFSTDSDLGQAYLAAMHLAGEYAYAGRDWVVNKVLEILGAESTFEVHNHHNFAWRERHQGRDLWVIRKGCTPAFPGQQGFVGSTMADESVILEGVDSEDSSASLYSTVHGAGRVMSRTKAAGKRRRRKVEGKVVVEQKTKGVVDWSAVKARMREQNIILRGGAADEAPEVYKSLTDVLAAHGDTIAVQRHLRPLAVAMAGADTFDPFKD